MHSPVGVHYNSDEDMMPHLENGELWTNNVDYLDTYKSMEQLVDLGLVRSLGLSNFNLDQLQRLLLSCRIKPAALQIECHPELVQIPLMELCKLHNITVVAYSPLGRPTTGRPLPEFYKDTKVVEMAKKYQKTPAQVVLRYLIDLGTVPIPKAAQKGHLKENLDVFDFKLTTEELLHFESFNRGQRIWKFEKAKHHQYYPY
ncbi:aldo-keto reductase family 1 member A1-A isoform X2 [Drosophila kikkawai]